MTEEDAVDRDCKNISGDTVATNSCILLFRLNRLRPDARRDVAIAGTDNHFTFFRLCRKGPGFINGKICLKTNNPRYDLEGATK